jgi:hypothetical protein
MKIFANSLTIKALHGFIVLVLAVALLNACSSNSAATNPGDQSQLARQTEQLQKLKSAEYQDDLSTMSFEDNNQKLGNYYAQKGVQVHHLIDQLEEGHQVSDTEIHHALDNSDSEKYDNRPPVPLEDETGNGY